MSSSALDVSTIAPLQHGEAMRLLESELRLTIDLLAQLGSDEWTSPTACPDWDVRHMYLHVLGACEGSASVREGLHQLRAAGKRRRANGGPLEANLSAVQVAERESIDAVQLVQRLRDIAPKTVKARKRLPGFIRRWAKVGVDAPVVEKWAIGYLVDTIYLRDLWMHRLDAADATRREPTFSSEHDGRIVADVVGEWGRRHGKPFTLQLVGAAGGSFVMGSGGEPIVLDAAEFCRVLSGRAPGAGLLATVVPF